MEGSGRLPVPASPLDASVSASFANPRSREIVSCTSASLNFASKIAESAVCSKSRMKSPDSMSYLQITFGSRFEQVVVA
jgi:hypothetical protein